MAIQTATDVRREAARKKDTGRFGDHARTAPEVALGSTDFDAEQARREEAAGNRRREAQFLRAAELAADSFESRNGLSGVRDDIVGDAVVSILDQQARDKRISLDTALAYMKVSQVASQRVGGEGHHTDRAARKKIDAWYDVFLQTEHRDPTQREITEAADRIRLAQPAGQRPTIGYENPVETISLDDEQHEHIRGSLVADPDSGFSADRSKAAAAVDALEEGGTFKAADARKNLWNILASDQAPSVAVASLDDDRTHRAHVKQYGGAAASARAWQLGETSENDPVNEALFAPFGALREKEREQVTALLLRNPDYADRIWDSAMTAAVDVAKLRAKKRREARATASQEQLAA
ncbi:hypothetical protein [Microbacterium sp. 77mftsu3.1]|uniref:hypothetical protein n=1 Tax=Microbacterium sp. 77mftsu3.1 TaxID=1761802 RepID=UPI00037F7EF6|nr:hypothetical protein [Microbacterium sp. 77mftsu3.1]SDH34255.1 hypothetical protein SAMN04488590_3078 [Microbacterium sp. 77mftsu3.1]